MGSEITHRGVGLPELRRALGKSSSYFFKSSSHNVELEVSPQIQPEEDESHKEHTSHFSRGQFQWHCVLTALNNRASSIQSLSARIRIHDSDGNFFDQKIACLEHWMVAPRETALQDFLIRLSTPHGLASLEILWNETLSGEQFATKIDAFSVDGDDYEPNA